MNVRDRLARLAGAQLDLLRAAPGDYDKHTAMGGVLLSTAAVAGVSATFALYTAVGLSVLASVLAGLIWAVIILNLDRMLVVSMTRQTGLWLNLATAVPRILLAIIIGAVISTPLVLRIFQPEIDNELQVLHAENLIAGQQKLDEQFADIRPMQDRVDQLQAIAAGQIQPGVNTDPDVQAAQAAVDTAQTAYDQAARNAQCELDGSCGTGTAGEGEAWRRAQALADQALGTLTAAKAKLAQTEAVARERISGSVASNQQAAEQELTTLRPALRQRLDDRAAAQQRLDRGEANNSGLLARLEALDRLSAERPVTRTANIALFLLFLFIEILPVLVKLLIGIGKPTLYEKIAQRREKDANRADLIWSRKQKAIASVRSNVRYRLEKDRATAQIDAGKVMNAELVARQTAIAEQAIDVWGKVAAARSDEALRRWYAQHSAGNGLPVLPQPTQTQPTQTRGTSPVRTSPEPVNTSTR